MLKARRPDHAYFWATHNGAELDLGLHHLYVVSPGARRYPRGRRVTVVPLDEFVSAARAS